MGSGAIAGIVVALLALIALILLAVLYRRRKAYADGAAARKKKSELSETLTTMHSNPLFRGAGGTMPPATDNSMANPTYGYTGGAAAGGQNDPAYETIGAKRAGIATPGYASTLAPAMTSASNPVYFQNANDPSYGYLKPVSGDPTYEAAVARPNLANYDNAGINNPGYLSNYHGRDGYMQVAPNDTSALNNPSYMMQHPNVGIGSDYARPGKAAASVSNPGYLAQHPHANDDATYMEAEYQMADGDHYFQPEYQIASSNEGESPYILAAPTSASASVSNPGYLVQSPYNMASVNNPGYLAQSPYHTVTEPGYDRAAPTSSAPAVSNPSYLVQHPYDVTIDSGVSSKKEKPAYIPYNPTPLNRTLAKDDYLGNSADA
jgi:hypothetical protein